jgi:hypothetical protein
MTVTKGPVNRWTEPSMIVSYAMAAWAAFASYSTFQNDTHLTVDRLKEKVTTLEAENKLIREYMHGRRKFMIEAGNMIDYMCGKDASCERRFEPLEIPE